MRSSKAQLRSTVSDLAVQVAWLQADKAGLEAKLDQVTSRVHACPVCGVRHTRSDALDGTISELRTALKNLLTTTEGLMNPDSEEVRAEHDECDNDPTACDLVAVLEARRVLEAEGR